MNGKQVFMTVFVAYLGEIYIPEQYTCNTVQ